MLKRSSKRYQDDPVWLILARVIPLNPADPDVAPTEQQVRLLWRFRKDLQRCLRRHVGNDDRGSGNILLWEVRSAMVKILPTGLRVQFYDTSLAAEMEFKLDWSWHLRAKRRNVREPGWHC